MNNSNDRFLKQELGCTPQPHLSANFNERLWARIQEPLPRPLEHRAKTWLRIYWLAAVAVSIFIIIKIEWPRELVESPWISYLSWSLILILPFAALIQTRQIKKLVAFLDSVLR